jgi:hypothetical protein
VDLANLGSESETCVGSRVRLVGVSISIEKNFYRLPFTPPSLVRSISLPLVPVVSRAYITFGDNGRGREMKVSDKVTLRHVALVQTLGFNLFIVSQSFDEGFQVLFRPSGSRILDYRGYLVCMVVLEGQVFQADFFGLLVWSVVSWLVLRVSCGSGIGRWVT